MADDGDRNEATPQEVQSMLRELTASQRETDRHMRKTDRRLRKLDELFNGQWGKLIEALVTGDLNRRDIAVHRRPLAEW